MKKKRKYIYLEKCLIIRILQIYIFSFYDFLFFISLSNAICIENISQYFIHGYSSANLFIVNIKFSYYVVKTLKQYSYIILNEL